MSNIAGCVILLFLHRVLTKYVIYIIIIVKITIIIYSYYILRVRGCYEKLFPPA